MPITMRPSERSCSVAYALASTVGSRVPGLVTKWPILIFEVSRAATASRGIDSCQRTCESYVHAYSKPWLSASLISSRKRAYGGSGRTVTPKLIMRVSLPRRRQRREGGQHAERGEADPAVTGQRERQADERRADHDQERRQPVDHTDRRPRCVGPRGSGAGERHRERDSGGEAGDGRRRDEARQRQRGCESDGARAAE